MCQYGKNYKKVAKNIRVHYRLESVAGLIHSRTINRVGKDMITTSLTDVMTQEDTDGIRKYVTVFTVFSINSIKTPLPA